MSVDVDKIRRALDTLSTNQQALEWLTEHGEAAISDDGFRFMLCIERAGLCHGVDDARSALATWAKKRAPDILADAIRDCTNTIAICERIIREEIGA